MVECARLESGYTLTGIKGSNPLLSAQKRDSNRLAARRERRRKPERADERRTNIRGIFGRQPWTSEPRLF